MNASALGRTGVATLGRQVHDSPLFRQNRLARYSLISPCSSLSNWGISLSGNAVSPRSSTRSFLSNCQIQRLFFQSQEVMFLEGFPQLDGIGFAEP
jgi:hypothetical protein